MRVPAFALGLAAAATLAAAPLSPASAHDHWGHRGHGAGIFFPLAIAGAVIGTTAAIVTAPVRALADAASAPVYAAPAPVYAAPAPAYYAAPPQQAPVYYAAPQQAPAYYPPPPQAYYPPPPQAYYPPPAYAYPYPPR